MANHPCRHLLTGGRRHIKSKDITKQSSHRSEEDSAAGVLVLCATSRHPEIKAPQCLVTWAVTQGLMSGRSQ